MKRTLFAILILVFLILGMSEAFAQCSMCKAVVESDQQGGGNMAAGLNSGILYLMMFPYLLIGGIGYMWYRHKKATR